MKLISAAAALLAALTLLTSPARARAETARPGDNTLVAAAESVAARTSDDTSIRPFRARFSDADLRDLPIERRAPNSARSKISSGIGAPITTPGNSSPSSTHFRSSSRRSTASTFTSFACGPGTPTPFR
jgi:hypothetical protein